jgi:hypothetical protein
MAARFNISEQGRGFRYSEAQKKTVLNFLKKNENGKSRGKPTHRHGTFTEALAKFGVTYPAIQRWMSNA